MVILKGLQDRIDSIFEKLGDPEQNIRWSYYHHQQLKNEVEQYLKRIKAAKKMLKQNYITDNNYKEEYNEQLVKATELNDQRLAKSIVEFKQLIDIHDDTIKKQFNELLQAEQQLNRSSKILNIRILILKLNMDLVKSDYEVNKVKMHLLEDINQLSEEIGKSSFELSGYVHNEKAIKNNMNTQQHGLLKRLYEITEELEQFWQLVPREKKPNN
ncbi:MAG: hypothetical protein FH758_12320 [Firmicutes bacterium]|nr:hypothetical protein [Bacillota bacterium]